MTDATRTHTLVAGSREIKVFTPIREQGHRPWGASLPAGKRELQLVFIDAETQLVVVLPASDRIDLAMTLLGLDGMQAHVKLTRPREPKADRVPRRRLPKKGAST